MIMRYMKKAVVYICSLFCLWGCFFSIQASDFSFGVQDNGIEATKEVNVWGVEEDQWEELISVIKSVINRTLGILGMIALILVIYGWFLMLISAGDEWKYDQWRKILKSAALGLIFIGISWFVASIIFFLIVRAADGAVGADSI